jgi:ferredoxin-NADP reductase
MDGGNMRLKLVEKRVETADTKSFFFDGSADVKWKAGQYIHYQLPHANPDDRGIERYFSISSAPCEGRVRLTCRFAPKSSSFKKALDALPIGGEIEGDFPEGDFCVENAAKPLVFIAGGIGITPFRAILIDLERREMPLHIHLLYANKDADAPFRAELESFAARHPSVRLNFFIGDDRLDGNRIRQHVPNLKRHRVYVSGPESMVGSFDQLLKALGVADADVMNDFFPGYDWP